MSDIKERLEALRKMPPGAQLEAVTYKELCYEALLRIDTLEAKIEELNADNDEQWERSGKLATDLESVIKKLRGMRRSAAGEDS